jgi:hypothetical protein
MKPPVTRRGNVLYEPDGKVLTEYFWDRSRLSVIQGPQGSGTSTASAMKLWAIACEQAPDWDGVRRSNWWIVRETFPLHREGILKTTWPLWFPEEDWGAMVKTEPMRHVLRKAHPSGDKTTVEAQITFVAIRDEIEAERQVPSVELTGFFYNEAQFQSLKVITLLLGRTGRYPSKKNGPGATWWGGFLDLNAPEEGHWIPYMRGDVPLPPDWSDEQKRPFTKPENWSFYVQPPGLLEKVVDGKIAYSPNPEAENQKWLREPYIEKIGAWDQDQIDRLILNKVGLTKSGKAVYPTYSARDHTYEDDRAAVPGFPIIVGLDFGNYPAACFCQLRGDTWHVLSELVGNNEPAVEFAPRVARHIAQRYPGFQVNFWGDPRGGDGTQVSNVTSYDVYQANGMRVLPATTNNDPELRRSSVGRVLSRRDGLRINVSCLTLKTGLAGGYHYSAVKGRDGALSYKPVKNIYSHITEAFENAILGGGEGYAMIRADNVVKLQPSPVMHRRIKWK